MGQGGNKVGFSVFVDRYESLKRQYFSPRSNPQFEDGEEVPSAFPSKSQIVAILQNELKVQPPYSPTERVIRFIDGQEITY